MQKNKTKIIAITGMMITIAIVLRYLGIMIPIGGIGGMRISFSGFFSKLPAVLFGGVIGGVASGLIDIIGYLIKPEGAFIPLLTVTAILGGVIVGILWKQVANISPNIFRIFFRSITAVFGIFVIITFITMSFFKESSYASFLLSLNGTRYSLFTYGSLITFVLCVIVCITDYVILKKQPNLAQKFMRLLFVLLCANIIVTTLNTCILRMFIPALNNLAFFIFYTPRLIEEVLMTMIQCYGMVFLLGILQRLKIDDYKV